MNKITIFEISMILVWCFLQDGRIDYGEFAAMMRKGDGGVGRTRTMRNNLNFNLADAFGVDDLGMKDATSDANWRQYIATVEKATAKLKLAIFCVHRILIILKIHPIEGWHQKQSDHNYVSSL